MTRLVAWLRTQLPKADDVRIHGLDRVEFGHSAEMMVLTVVTTGLPQLVGIFGYARACLCW